MPPRICEESPEDIGAISALVTAAFGTPDEARLIEKLREAGLSRISLVAWDGKRLVGHVLFSELPVDTPTGRLPGLALAPLAVLPASQSQGFGTDLVRAGLAAAARQGYAIVCVLGNPAYYQRFGFSLALGRQIASPYSGQHWMALELGTAALGDQPGSVEYPAVFSELG